MRDFLIRKPFGGDAGHYFNVHKEKIRRRAPDLSDGPIHHTLPEKRIPEPKIVTRFLIVGIILAVLPLQP
jgi:phospho-N-acetylmuramoyl-pentapeptide-transferase